VSAGYQHAKVGHACYQGPGGHPQRQRLASQLAQPTQVDPESNADQRNGEEETFDLSDWI
jgi:hypothetical protein